MAIGGFLMILGLVLTALRCCLLPWLLRRRRRLQLLQHVKKDESQACALGVSGSVTQSTTDNEKNSQIEVQNGTKPMKLDDMKGEYDGLVNAELGLIDGSSSSVADTLPPQASISSSGDALHTVVSSPSELDVLINKSSSSNLDQSSRIATQNM
jgi:hypothetical protein